jgi:alpha-L-fucosidase
VWSTTDAAAKDGSGDMMGSLFCPAEADTPVAAKDAWFWKPQQMYRPLPELYSVYKNTVGANSLLELGVLPDDTGAIPADQMAALQGLGDYIRACHSPQAALAAGNGTTATLHLTFPAALVNRVILQEDLSRGQLVQGFTVQVDAAGGWAKHVVTVAEGTAIGNKRILYFSSGAILAEGVYVTVTALYPGFTEANFKNVAVYSPCALEQ